MAETPSRYCSLRLFMGGLPAAFFRLRFTRLLPFLS